MTTDKNMVSATSNLFTLDKIEPNPHSSTSLHPYLSLWPADLREIAVTKLIITINAEAMAATLPQISQGGR